MPWPAKISWGAWTEGECAIAYTLKISGVDLEATGGFEPPNRGFADLRLNRLATSPRFQRPRLDSFGAEGGI